MIFEVICKNNKKYYSRKFISWMDKEYPTIKRSDIIFSNIMLSINNDIGFSINDLILKKITIDEYADKYRLYFESINRKSPKGHASVHKWNAKFLLEFIYANYKLQIQ